MGRNQLNLENILKSLGKERPIFSSEADFQFALAWQIEKYLKRNKVKDYRVRLEYCPGISFKKTLMHIDIIVFIKEGYIPIELKYKTKEGGYTSGIDKYKLKTQGARNISCHAYIKDINRIEYLRDEYKDFKFIEGYTIFLTNDEVYLRKPNKNCDYRKLSLHNETNHILRKNKYLKFNNGVCAKKYPSIRLKDDYKINWNVYSEIDSNTTFYYLINKIKNN